MSLNGWVQKGMKIWAREDSNLQPTDYESAALPLSYGPGYVSLQRGLLRYRFALQ